METLERHLTPEEQQLFCGLDTPAKIQAFLDKVTYAPEYENRSPVKVLRDRRAHCLDGGAFAAAALRRLGFPPMLVDIFPDPGMDDDHVLAVYRLEGRWGALAKSNYSGLRLREPVYRSLHELVMSYFEQFFNVNGIKTLRSYTSPLRLAPLDGYGWEWQDSGVDEIERHLLALPRRMLITPKMAANLSPVDERSYRAGMVGVNEAGLYQPKV